MIYSPLAIDKKPMNVIHTYLPEMILFEPKMFGDMHYQANQYEGFGVSGPFAQDNLSQSVGGVICGIHLQNPGAQGRLVSVMRGRVIDFDVRAGSPTFGKHQRSSSTTRISARSGAREDWSTVSRFSRIPPTSSTSAMRPIAPQAKLPFAGTILTSGSNGAPRLLRCQRGTQRHLSLRNSRACRDASACDAHPADWH